VGECVLGIESTAHTAGVGVVAPDGTVLANRSAFYTPAEGIHPREAARHHAAALPELVHAALADAGVAARELALVAYARGPGLGPCLRTGATAARALAHVAGVPVLGVNHCVAHLEIGLLEGARDPVLLYLSGGNTQVIAHSAGRYRVFGETLDIGLGNALDKFAREAGLGFPGGPKLEALAQGPELLALPYSVKGMDLAFSGLITAALKLRRDGAPLAQVAFSLQETSFAMACEVAERALAHTGKGELVLGGGVACNARLREMAETMTRERDAVCYAPPSALCVDNGAMIAWLGHRMVAGGYRPGAADDIVDQKFRTDAVEVTWR